MNRDGRRAHAQAQLNTSGQNRSVNGIDRAGPGQLLIVKIGKFGTARVVAGGVHIRQIVRNRFNPHLLGAHSGGGDF